MKNGELAGIAAPIGARSAGENPLWSHTDGIEWRDETVADLPVAPRRGRLRGTGPPSGNASELHQSGPRRRLSRIRR